MPIKQANPSKFRLTSQQLDYISRRSTETGVSKNRVVRLAIDAYFKKLDEEEELSKVVPIAND